MRDSSFEVGGRYRNRLTGFEVLRIEGDHLAVCLDDGSEAVYSAEMQQRIIGNMQREQARLIPAGVAAGRDADFAWTLGALSATGRLEAEIPPRAWQGFVNTYYGYTGATLTPNSRGVFLLAGSDKKWGPELRVYFPDWLPASPRFALPGYVSVVAAFSANERRVNNNAFWWHLVERCGFVAGPSQDGAAIRLRFSPELRLDFDSGSAETGG